MSFEKNRQRKTKNPCALCFLHPERCICSSLPKLNLQTKLSLIIHHRELKRTTNTGRLAVQALVNSEMYIRGLENKPLDFSHLLTSDFEHYLLYPSDDAIEMSELKPQKPVHLIVSDGNWRQASKVHRRQVELSQVPKVKISKVNLAKNHLRNEHMSVGYSTLEAIAMAFGIFEGESVQNELLSVYQAKLHATMKGRGK
jgi:DTW domain-containing protein YfiP